MMIALYIGLGFIFLFIIFGFVVAFTYHKKMFGNRWQPDGITKYYELNDFPNLDASPIEFKRKKVTLRGFIYSYKKEEYKGILVFSHGMWGSHKAYLQEIERMAKAGFLVLGFDYCGTDLSDGKNTRAMSESLVSLDYAIRFAKKQYNNYDIYVMGHSWGGFASVNIAKYHPEIKKIVAMAPFMSVPKLLKSTISKKLWVFIPFMMVLEFIKSGFHAFSDGIKVLNKTKSNTLILHSTDDFLVKYQYHTGKLLENNKNKLVRIVTIDKKRHNPDYSLDAVEYMIDMNKKLRTISDNEEKINFRKTWDFKRMGTLDDQIISDIVDFLK